MLALRPFCAVMVNSVVLLIDNGIVGVIALFQNFLLRCISQKNLRIHGTYFAMALNDAYSAFADGKATKT